MADTPQQQWYKMQVGDKWYTTQAESIDSAREKITGAHKQYFPEVQQAISTVPKPQPPEAGFFDKATDLLQSMRGIPLMSSGLMDPRALPVQKVPVAGTQWMGGPREAIEGAEQMSEGTRKDLMGGGARVIGGSMQTLTPLMVAGAIEAPFVMGAGLVGSELGSRGGAAITKKLGGGPEAQALAGQLGGLAGGLATGGGEFYRERYSGLVEQAKADFRAQRGFGASVDETALQRAAEAKVQTDIAKGNSLGELSIEARNALIRAAQAGLMMPRDKQLTETFGKEAKPVLPQSKPEISPSDLQDRVQAAAAKAEAEKRPMTPAEVGTQRVQSLAEQEKADVAKLQQMRASAPPQKQIKPEMQGAEKATWQETAFGQKPPEDIGKKVRAASPEPTRAEVKAAAEKKAEGPTPPEVTQRIDALKQQAGLYWDSYDKAWKPVAEAKRPIPGAAPIEAKGPEWAQPSPNTVLERKQLEMRQRQAKVQAEAASTQAELEANRAQRQAELKDLREQSKTAPRLAAPPEATRPATEPVPPGGKEPGRGEPVRPTEVAEIAAAKQVTAPDIPTYKPAIARIRDVENYGDAGAEARGHSHENVVRARALLSAIEQAPKENLGTLYRGYNPTTGVVLRPGEILNLPFSSFSLDPETAKMHGKIQLQVEGPAQVFKAFEHSPLPQEQEVFSKGQFRIKSVEGNTATVEHINAKRQSDVSSEPRSLRGDLGERTSKAGLLPEEFHRRMALREQRVAQEMAKPENRGIPKSEIQRRVVEQMKKEKGAFGGGGPEDIRARREAKINEWINQIRDHKSDERTYTNAYKMLKAYGLEDDEIIRRVSGAEGFAETGKHPDVEISERNQRAAFNGKLLREVVGIPALDPYEVNRRLTQDHGFTWHSAEMADGSEYSQHKKGESIARFRNQNGDEVTLRYSATGNKGKIVAAGFSPKVGEPSARPISSDLDSLKKLIPRQERGQELGQSDIENRRAAEQGLRRLNDPRLKSLQKLYGQLANKIEDHGIFLDHLGDGKFDIYLDSDRLWKHDAGPKDLPPRLEHLADDFSRLKQIAKDMRDRMGELDAETSLNERLGPNEELDRKADELLGGSTADFINKAIEKTGGFRPLTDYIKPDTSLQELEKLGSLQDPRDPLMDFLRKPASELSEVDKANLRLEIDKAVRANRMKKEGGFWRLFPAKQKPVRAGNSTLDELTAKLEASKVAIPPDDSRMRIMERLDKTVTEGWDSARLALGRVQAQAIALHDWYLRPGEMPTDYNTAMGRFSGALNRTAWELRQFTKEIKAKIPDARRREAITNWIQAGGDDAVLAERAARSKGALRAGYEAARNLTEDEKLRAKDIQSYFDKGLKDAINQGILQHGIEDYVPQIWKKPEAQIGQINFFSSLHRSGLVKPDFNAAKKRFFESYFEGEQAGHKPVSKDIGFLVAAWGKSFNQAIASRALIRDLSHAVAEDGRPVIAPSGVGRTIYGSDTPAAGDPASAYLIYPKAGPEETGDYVALNHPALRKWTWVGKDSEGAPIFVQGDLRVHPKSQFMDGNRARTTENYASKLDNVINRGRWAAEHPVQTTLLKGQAFFKATLLSMSPFHQIQEGTHALFHKVNPFNPGPIDLANPSMGKLLDHGLVIGNYDPVASFEEGLNGVGLMNKIPGIGHFLQKYGDYLFSDYIPRLKSRMAVQAYEQNLKRFSDDIAQGKVTSDQIAELTANQANAAFGELNYVTLGRHPQTQAMLRMMFLAPDFLESRARFVGQALRPYGREQAAALVRGAAGMYVIARVLNQVLDGDPHWDPKHAFSLVVHGYEYKIRSLPGDILHLLTDPNSFIQHRLNPTLTKPLMELSYGKDDFGRRRTLGEQAMDFVKGVTPIPMQAFGEAKGKLGARLGRAVLGSMGVTSTKYRTNAAAMAHQYALDSMKDIRSHHVGDIVNDIDTGQYDPNRVRDLIKSGEMNPEDFLKALKLSQLPELYRDYRGLPVEQKAKVWAAASPKERAILQAYGRKEMDMTKLLPQQREEFVKEFTKQ